MGVPSEFAGVVSALQSSFATTLQSGLNPFQQQMGEQGNRIEALEKKAGHIDTATATMQTMITNDYKHFVAENKKTSDKTEALGAKMGKLEEDTFELAGNVQELSEEMKKETTAVKREMQKEMQKAKRARTDVGIEMEGVRDEMQELRDEMQVMRDEVYGMKQQKVAMQREMAQMREEFEPTGLA